MMMTTTRWRSMMMSMVVVLLLLGGSGGGGAGAGAERVPDFFVEGEVYCDTCRAGFVTNATTPIEGAKVRLECRHFMSASGAVERAAEGVTGAAGKYRIELADNRGSEEVCAVRLVSSPMPGCKEAEVGRDRAPVTLVPDAGLATMVRRANPLGFLRDQPLPICGQLLTTYALRTAPSY